MIKIFTDTSFMTPQYRSSVFPLLFDLCYINNKVLLEKYNIVDSIKEADVVILPIAIECFFAEKRTVWMYEFIANGNLANKIVWVYSAGDIGLTLNIAVYTFRLGGFASKLDNHSYVMPSFIGDPYNILESEFEPIPKTKLPTIGFVGHASGGVLKKTKEFLIYLKHNAQRFLQQVHTDYQEFYPSSIKRYQFLSILEKSSELKTHFFYRTQYRAGAKTKEDKIKSSLVFLENIKDNAYTFCLRGAGNFSVRFYETLAMGRIPLVMDTDFRLPIDSLIQWENHCVIANIDNFIETLIDFHTTISDADFEQMQYNNRKLWLTYLNRDSYFSTIHDHFKKIR